MEGYILRFVDHNDNFYCLGKGFQSTDGMFLSEANFKSLTWRTYGEALRAGEEYIKKNENYGLTKDYRVITIYYSGKGWEDNEGDTAIS